MDCSRAAQTAGTRQLSALQFGVIPRIRDGAAALQAKGITKETLFKELGIILWQMGPINPKQTTLFIDTSKNPNVPFDEAKARRYFLDKLQDLGLQNIKFFQEPVSLTIADRSQTGGNGCCGLECGSCIVSPRTPDLRAQWLPTPQEVKAWLAPPATLDTTGDAAGDAIGQSRASRAIAAVWGVLSSARKKP